MSQEKQQTDETPESDVMNTDNDSGENQNEGAKTASKQDMDATSKPSDSNPDPKETTHTTPTGQQLLTSESAEQSLSMLQDLLDRQNFSNQKLNEIWKEIEEFKENNLLEASPVIHKLIQFYDTFVSVESQLNAVDKAFESLGKQIEVITDTPQSDAIPDPQIDAITGTLKAVKEMVDDQLSGTKRLTKKGLRDALTDLQDMLAKSLSAPQEDTGAGDGAAEHQEEQQDSLSSLFKTNTEMGDELIRFRNNLEHVRLEFLDVLGLIYDVELYVTETDPPEHLFDRTKHRALTRKSTKDTNQDRLVVESHKAGFYRVTTVKEQTLPCPEKVVEVEKQTVFRPEEVTVYRYEKPADEPTETDGEVLANEQETADTGTEGTTVGNSTTDVSDNEKEMENNG